MTTKTSSSCCPPSSKISPRHHRMLHHPGGSPRRLCGVARCVRARHHRFRDAQAWTAWNCAASCAPFRPIKKSSSPPAAVFLPKPPPCRAGFQRLLDKPFPLPAEGRARQNVLASARRKKIFAPTSSPPDPRTNALHPINQQYERQMI